MREGPLKDEYWSGLGIIVTGAGLDLPPSPSAYAVPTVYEAFSKTLVGAGGSSDPLTAAQLAELEQELATQKNLMRLMESSWSWRLTAPLRAAKRIARHAGNAR